MRAQRGPTDAPPWRSDEARPPTHVRGAGQPLGEQPHGRRGPYRGGNRPGAPGWHQSGRPRQSDWQDGRQNNLPYNPHERFQGDRRRARLPDGWTMFRPFGGIAWFYVPEEDRSGVGLSSSGGEPRRRRRYRVLGLLPCKVPLHPDFGETIRHAQMGHEMRTAPEDIEAERMLSLAERTMREKDRTAVTQFFELWSPYSAAGMIATARRREREDCPARDFSLSSGGSSESLDKQLLSPPSARDQTETRRPPTELPTKAKVVGVIDLTATRRYYDLENFHEQGAQAVWCKLEGSCVPDREGTLRILSVWSDLWRVHSVSVEAEDEIELAGILTRSDQADSMPLVLMHCTHGVNRTGAVFSILSWVHTRGSTSIDDANRAFTRVRGHAMNKPEMHETLTNIFSDPLDEYVRHPAAHAEGQIIFEVAASCS